MNSDSTAPLQAFTALLMLDCRANDQNRPAWGQNGGSPPLSLASTAEAGEAC